jgi:hypothetical protein
MHSFGFFIKSNSSFSEASCGSRTAIYLKLIGDMTPHQWARFYATLQVHENIRNKLKEFGQPAEEWTDDPNKYFIAGSDPADDEDINDNIDDDEDINDNIDNDDIDDNIDNDDINDNIDNDDIDDEE